MSKDEIMNDSENGLPEELAAIEASLGLLGQAERDSAPAGFEAGLMSAVGEALTPDAIPLTKNETRRLGWTPGLRLAAAVLLTGSAGLLTWTAVGVFGTGNGLNTIGGGAISEVALGEDVDLLLELMETDYVGYASDNGVSYGAELDDLALDVLQMDSELEPSWDTLDSWVDSFVEGAI